MVKNVQLGVVNAQEVKDRGLQVVNVDGARRELVLALGPAGALGFAFVHQALTGLYMASIFAPNHKGMPLAEANSASRSTSASSVDS